MQKQFSVSILKSLPRSFTLIELIIVIVIVGILAAIGMTQYSLIVERGRTAEAKVRIGNMRTLAYQYYLENGILTGMTNADVGVDNTCVSTNFFKYTVVAYDDYANLFASRCTSGGKTPNVSSMYRIRLEFHPDTGQDTWGCMNADGSSCFGMPSW